MVAQLLGERLAVCLLRPPLRGLSLVAEDEVELVLIARTLPPRLGALVARRLRLVTLPQPSALFRRRTRGPRAGLGLP